MRALITRPRADAAELERRLRRRGIRTMVEPMLTIELLPEAGVDLSDVQGLLFTSSNGARSFAAFSGRRDIPAFAVGDATARTCREAGFETVHSAGGDVDDLARLVIRTVRPGDGRLVHVSGSVSAGDLAGALGAAGFDVARVPFYRALPAGTLSDALDQALRRGHLDLVLFFSPRTAATFVSLVRAAGLERSCRTIDALCLSPAVARRAAELSWRQVTVAAAPTQTALLEALDSQYFRDRPNGTT